VNPNIAITVSKVIGPSWKFGTVISYPLETLVET